ncbi:hypothetical protein REH81_17385 [Vibrio rotiferianus]
MSNPHFLVEISYGGSAVYLGKVVNLELDPVNLEWFTKVTFSGFYQSGYESGYVTITGAGNQTLTLSQGAGKTLDKELEKLEHIELEPIIP